MFIKVQAQQYKCGLPAQLHKQSQSTQKRKKGTLKTQDKSSKFNNNNNKQQYKQSTKIKAPCPTNIDKVITECHQLGKESVLIK